MKKFMMVAGITAGLTVAMSMTAFAGWDQMGTAWKYQNTDGAYLANTWAWIDGNNDGIAESYCFDGNGNLYVNVRTPDQYVVNENGAWTLNGVVQTMVVGNIQADPKQTQTDSTQAQETKPAPKQETQPAPVEQTQPAPVQQTQPAPVEQTQPAPSTNTNTGLIPGTNIPSTGDPEMDAFIREEQQGVTQGGIGEYPDDYVDQGAGLNWN